MVAEDLLDERRGQPREPAPAELDGPRHPDPAGLAEGTVDGDRVAVREHPLAPPLGVALEQGAQAGAEGGRVGAEGALLGCRSQVQRCPTLPGRIATVEHRRAFITVADGTRLAARLWLPDGSPRRSLLEALPYRMDDLTSSYSAEYERLCEEGGLAVCRLDIRGTGSSSGLATDEYTAEEHDDICQVIAWLAEQEWSNGRVGMYGTSWSGFNSLQVACLRPPALGAIAPIYASDDRYTDDVHYMGGALKALDLIDWPIYMVAGNALPPVPAVFGDGWREEWARRIDEVEPVAPALVRGAGRRAVLAPRLGAAGLRQDRLPDDDRRRLGRRVHEHRLPRLRGAHLPEARHPRPLGPRLDRNRAARAAHRPRAGADPLVPPLARRRGERRRRRSRRSPSSPAARRGRRPDLAEMRGEWRSEATWPPERLVEHVLRPDGEGTETIHVRGDVGRAAWISCAGGGPVGAARTISGSTTRSRSPTTGTCSEADLDVMGHPRVRLTRHLARARRLPLGAALRRLPRRNLRPRGPGDPQPRAPQRARRTGRARAGRADRDRDRARGDLVGVRAGPPGATRALGSRLAEHLAAAERRAARRSSAASVELVLPVLDGPPPLPAPSLPPTTGKDTHAPDKDDRAAAGRLAVRGRPARARDPRRDELRLRLRGALRSPRRGALRGHGRCLDGRPGARVGARTTVYRITWPEADVRTEARLEVRSDADAYHVVVELVAEELGAGAGSGAVPPRAALRAHVPAPPRLNDTARRQASACRRAQTQQAGRPVPAGRRPATSRSSGSVSLQRASATGQRGWKRQPGGTRTGFGVSPVRICGAVCSSGSRRGTTEISAFVYGCCGLRTTLPRRPLLDDPPQVHDRDPVGEVGRRREVVRDHEDAHPVLAQPVEERQDPRPHRDVEHRDRLVGDQQLRLEHERGRDRDPLALAARELVRIAVDEELGRRQPGPLHRLAHLRLALVLRARRARARGSAPRSCRAP